jgi:glycosyltransferase involved in cell wall biosynthesis
MNALNSVAKQTYPAKEIIVVDDGSTDGTLCQLRNLSIKNLTVISQPHLGVSAARNRGIRQASSKWLAFLDSDDLWQQRKLELQVKYHQQFPNFKISQTNEVWFKNGKLLKQKPHHRKRSGWIFYDCLPRCVISPSAVIIHRQVFSQVGLFDTRLPVCEDYDLWLRVAFRYEIGLVEKPLVVKYGGHNDQLSAQYWGLDRFRVKALEKLLYHPLTSTQRRQVLETVVSKLEILVNGSKKREAYRRARRFQLQLDKYRCQLLECHCQ